MQAGHCISQGSRVGVAVSGYRTTEPGIAVRHKAMQVVQAAAESMSQAMLERTMSCRQHRPSMTACQASLLQYKLTSATGRLHRTLSLP